MSDHAGFYRKKPVVVEAMRLTADNPKDVCDWINSVTKSEQPVGYDRTGKIFLRTLEGVMFADIGDWIIKGTEGEFYPCKPAAFAATFERTP